MAQTAATSPGTMADDATVGTVAWSNVNNAKVSDNNKATATTSTPGTTRPNENEIKIVKSDGAIGTTNKSTGAAVPTAVDTYVSYGSSSDLWGETWTAGDINNANFGVVFSSVATETSHYLKATNFGFSIPSGATINGILAEIEQIGNFSVTSVDHIRITVYYTEAVTSPFPSHLNT